MTTDLMIIPLTVVIGEWTFVPDPFLSSGKKIIRNTNKQLKLDNLTEKTVDLTMRKREDSDRKMKVRNNLWRIVPGYGDWTEFLKLTLYKNLGKFTHMGAEYEYKITEINEKQYKIWIAYNESRNVFSEYIG